MAIPPPLFFETRIRDRRRYPRSIARARAMSGLSSCDLALDGAADVPGAEHELLHLDRAGEAGEVLPGLDQRIAKHRVLHQPKAERQHEPSAEAGRKLGVHDDQPATWPQLRPGFAQHQEVMRYGVVGQPEHDAVERSRGAVVGRVTLDQLDIAPVIVVAESAR